MTDRQKAIAIYIKLWIKNPNWTLSSPDDIDPIYPLTHDEIAALVRFERRSDLFEKACIAEAKICAEIDAIDEKRADLMTTLNLSRELTAEIDNIKNESLRTALGVTL